MKDVELVGPTSAIDRTACSSGVYSPPGARPTGRRRSSSSSRPRDCGTRRTRPGRGRDSSRSRRPPGVFDGNRPGRPAGVGQDRVGLVVVPDVGVRPPGIGLEVEDLGFQPAAAGRLARLALDRDRADQHRALGEPPVALVIEPDAAVAGDGQEPLGGRAVGPELGVDRVRDHARGRLMVAGRGEEAGLAQPAREVVR